MQEVHYPQGLTMSDQELKELAHENMIVIYVFFLSLALVHDKG